MCRGHCAWIHPLARCGPAATIAIVRSNTGFGKCRRRQTTDRQSGAYRTDHRHPLRIERPKLKTFPGPQSSCASVRMMKAALHTAHSIVRAQENVRIRTDAGLRFDRLGDNVAQDPSRRLQFFLRNPQVGRHQTVPRLTSAWPQDTSSIRRSPRSGMLSGRMPFRLPPRSTTY